MKWFRIYLLFLQELCFFYVLQRYSILSFFSGTTFRWWGSLVHASSGMNHSHIPLSKAPGVRSLALPVHFLLHRSMAVSGSPLVRPWLIWGKWKQFVSCSIMCLPAVRPCQSSSLIHCLTDIFRAPTTNQLPPTCVPQSQVHVKVQKPAMDWACVEKFTWLWD